MHVAQIAVAVTRDLITKYHYFHTSFQIWPDQIKVRARGRENCTLRGVIHPGVTAEPGGSAQWQCPRGHCRESSCRGHVWKRRFLGSRSSATCRLWEGPWGVARTPQGTDRLEKQHGPAIQRRYTSSAHRWLEATRVSSSFLPRIVLEHLLWARPCARP